MKSPGKNTGRYVPLKFIWHCPALQWGCYRAFPFIILERSVLAKSVTRGYSPKEGVRKPPLRTISVNIFFTFWRKNPNYA